MTTTTEVQSTRYAIAKEVVEHGVFGRDGSDTPRSADGCVLLEGAILDASTARALVLVFEALKPATQAMFDAKNLTALVDFCWSKMSFGGRA